MLFSSNDWDNFTSMEFTKDEQSLVDDEILQFTSIYDSNFILENLSYDQNHLFTIDNLDMTPGCGSTQTSAQENQQSDFFSIEEFCQTNQIFPIIVDGFVKEDCIQMSQVVPEPPTAEEQSSIGVKRTVTQLEVGDSHQSKRSKTKSTIQLAGILDPQLSVADADQDKMVFQFSRSKNESNTKMNQRIVSAFPDGIGIAHDITIFCTKRREFRLFSTTEPLNLAEIDKEKIKIMMDSFQKDESRIEFTPSTIKVAAKSQNAFKIKPILKYERDSTGKRRPELPVYVIIVSKLEDDIDYQAIAVWSVLLHADNFESRLEKRLSRQKILPKPPIRFVALQQSQSGDWTNRSIEARDVHNGCSNFLAQVKDKYLPPGRYWKCDHCHEQFDESAWHDIGFRVWYCAK